MGDWFEREMLQWHNGNEPLVWACDKYVRGFELQIAQKRHELFYEELTNIRGRRIKSKKLFNLTLRTYHEISMLTDIGLYTRDFEYKFWTAAVKVFGKRFENAFR